MVTGDTPHLKEQYRSDSKKSSDPAVEHSISLMPPQPATAVMYECCADLTKNIFATILVAAIDQAAAPEDVYQFLRNGASLGNRPKVAVCSTHGTPNQAVRSDKFPVYYLSANPKYLL